MAPKVAQEEEHDSTAGSRRRVEDREEGQAGEEGRPGMGQEMSVGRPVGLAEGGVAIHESG
jgi:hypothetical protein